jgi:hypothetical protein
MHDPSSEYADTCRTALAAERAASLSDTDGWSHVDRQQTHRDWDSLYRALAAMSGGSGAASPAAQALMAQHYAIACRFFVPSKDAYIGMSLFYDENPEMRTFHDQYGPDLVPFLGEAMQVFAHGNLSARPHRKQPTTQAEESA